MKGTVHIRGAFPGGRTAHLEVGVGRSQTDGAPLSLRARQVTRGEVVAGQGLCRAYTGARVDAPASPPCHLWRAFAGHFRPPPGAVVEIKRVWGR